MKKMALAFCFSILVSLSSHVLVTESQAALRPCTGKEVSVEISYRARIAILEFYTPGSSQIPSLREQLQNEPAPSLTALTFKSAVGGILIGISKFL